MPKPGPRTTYRYSPEFKATAVRLSELPGVAVSDVADSLYIHPFMLSRWRRLAGEGQIMTKGVDVDPAVAEFLTDDVVWLSIADGNVAVKANGKSDLIASMDAYFESCPTCRSEISESISTPARTSVIEIASWEGKSGPRSQRSSLHL